MSADVEKSKLPLKEVLKPTGFYPPESVKDLTFSEAVTSGEIETNREVTITANGDTEITPTSGKEAMKKVTATVAVPLEDNKAQSIDVTSYTGPIEITPTSGKTAMKKVTITLTGL